ncbi:MAG: peptidylprolyl isomerase [Gammaproteobacteria bacterium]|nr:peptidylprolyl isomerase [Gammaproteobacteria bacterium]
MKNYLSLFIATLLLCSSAVTAENSDSAATPPPAAANPQLEISTSEGKITIELFADKAPQSVANFLSYVDEKFYDGTIFHRVIDNFMVQGGGFDSDFQQKPTRAPVANEADNGLKNLTGTLAMARTADPQSATAQFYINVANNNFLDFREKTPRGWGYAVFGTVTSGMDVVAKIKSAKTGAAGPFPSDVPQPVVVIESIRRLNSLN